MGPIYSDDLAYIHHKGFAQFAQRAAPAIIAQIKRRHDSGLVVELGCGSGALTGHIVAAGFSVLGIDVSPAMIAIARTHFPDQSFRVGSLHHEALPRCSAVVAAGECINYRTNHPHDTHSDDIRDGTLFSAIYQALDSRGLFIFDCLTPGQIKKGTCRRHFTEGEDWAVLVEKREQPRTHLTRRIVTYRAVGNGHRRMEEQHVLRLYRLSHVLRALRKSGFRVHYGHRYGQFNLGTRNLVIVARKPTKR